MGTLDWREYVVSEEGVLGGRPVVRGTVIAADEVLDAIAGGLDVEGVVARFPQLSREAVLAVVQFGLARHYAATRHHMRGRPSDAPGPG